MAKEHPKLLISDKKGRISEVPFFDAAGMEAGHFFSLHPKDLVKLHPDSELFMLPERNAVGYDRKSKQFISLEGSYAVSAFAAPGYTAAYSAAYEGSVKSRPLPLFCYAAIASYKGAFYVPAIRVDREKRQELAGMDIRKLKKNRAIFKKLFPKNRLVRHLERCAFSYGCPAAKNFFLKRYEAPLPTSPFCNARCVGCISYQPERRYPVTQPRITFVPKPEEIAEVALHHIYNVKEPVVSFGQGCEGEPLMVGDVLEKAIKLIRSATTKGMINLNTNASRPEAIRRLFGAGLDSIRVSMNSVQEEYYSAYYLPRGYNFRDVLKSIAIAKKNSGFVSVNYLIMPGFNDWRKEARAFVSFLGKTKVDMVQWRNLNYDPREYFRDLKLFVRREDLIGIKNLISMVKKKYPKLMHGYFNPSKARIRRYI